MGSLLYRSIVRTNVFISLCAVAMYYTGVMFLNKEVRFSPDTLIIFIGTFLIYNISQNKFGDILHPRESIVKSMTLWVSAIIVLILSLYHFDLFVLAYFGHLGVISILYNSPILNNYKYLPLRGIPLIKVFLIAYIWANIGAIFPAIDFHVSLSDRIWWMFIAQFTFILAITLPFDIRDFYKDIRNELKTLPGAMGVRRTKLVAYVALFIYLFVTIFLLEWSLVWFLFGGLVFWMIYRSSASKKDYYYTFFIDGLIIVQFLIILIQNYCTN